MPTATPLPVEQSAKYVITGPAGDRAVLNDVTDPDFVGLLSKPPGGLERAAVRENAEDRSQADGRTHGPFYRSGIAFTLDGIIPPDPVGALPWTTRQDRLLAATDALRGDALLSWTTSTGVSVQLAFREQQATRITDARPKTFLVAGVSESATVRAAGLSVATLSPLAAGGGGRVYPKTYPKAYLSTAAASVIVTNLGRSLAWPVLRVFGPIVNPVLRNVTTGRDVRLRYSLNAGDYLELDTDPNALTVLLNGQASRYSAFDVLNSTWWGLPSGSSDVRLGADSFGVGAHLDILWRDAWG